MRRRQSVGSLNCDRERAAQIERPPADQVADVLSLDKLHCNEVNSVDIVQIKNGADVGVIERRSQTGFALEPFEVGFFDGKFRR